MQDLSTGDWVCRSVAKPVKMEHLRFRVRLFEAIYGSNGRVLWQVDQGYDERFDAACQIVKGTLSYASYILYLELTSHFA